MPIEDTEFQDPRSIPNLGPILTLGYLYLKVVQQPEGIWEDYSVSDELTSEQIEQIISWAMYYRSLAVQYRPSKSSNVARFYVSYITQEVPPKRRKE